MNSGGRVAHETRGWRPDRGQTVSQRSKEHADDYRYFPEPDLPPITVSREWVAELRTHLPELPDAKRARFESEYRLSRYDASLLTVSRVLADFFEDTVSAGATAKTAANWIARDILRELKEADLEIETTRLSSQGLAKLLGLVDDGRLTARSARDLLPELLSNGGDPEAIMAERGLEAVSDTGLIDGIVAGVIAANPDSVETIKGGDQKPLNFLMGQVMKATEGKANPAEVRRALQTKILDE